MVWAPLPESVSSTVRSRPNKYATARREEREKREERERREGEDRERIEVEERERSTVRGSESTKWVYEFEAEEVVLANLKLNADGQVPVKIMREIVRAAEDLDKTIILDDTGKRPKMVVSDRCVDCEVEEVD